MSDFNLGRHEAQIESLTIEVAALRTDVGEIKEFVANIKANWKMLGFGLTALGSAVGAVISLVVAYWRTH